MALKFLHTNDLHGKLDDAREARLADLRDQVDLYFDTGDCIKAGNLAIPRREEEVWARLGRLMCTAGTMGNRESHILESAQRCKLAGVRHPLLVANMRAKGSWLPVQPSLLIEVGSTTIGVLGVMVAIVTEQMSTRALSAFLWDNPIDRAAEVAEELRPQCDLVIALTHIGLVQDVRLAKRTGSIDIIFGGHSHSILPEPQRCNQTWICQGGSHGRFAGLYRWESGALSGELVTL